jgi:hypothetical protein
MSSSSPPLTSIRYVSWICCCSRPVLLSIIVVQWILFSILLSQQFPQPPSTTPSFFSPPPSFQHQRFNSHSRGVPADAATTVDIPPYKQSSRSRREEEEERSVLSKMSGVGVTVRMYIIVVGLAVCTCFEICSL